MVGIPKLIAALDGIDSGVLMRQGWSFVTYYETRQEDHEGTSAYNKVMEKASAYEHTTGIRRIAKGRIVYWEIWEQW